ncbi:LysM peptidoglycan-binding domain-containing protein [Spongiibacter sp. KMU-158]|uniref:LysM peptidoglycan-binding domain-containing protein n=1 Tax=Spongiibacter pelagi TaxID=2760804 RepID=A0A927GVN5_9GAMM|nr:LysM domain-containing protein [Spongiibacter pelagi]MBD2857584.1 LysM peptidoglycan-binding domain-containing protein [Spongiibacter pelagi]
MKKAVLGLCLGLIMAANADVLSLKAGHPQTYVVKKGDTLWDISAMYLEDPWLWPELWHYNPQVNNPHLIYPGDVLNLVWIDGKPRLVKGSGVVKLDPQMRISDVGSAIPSIPLDAVAPFLSRSRILTEDELKAAPYVLAGERGNIVAGAGDQILGRGNFGQETNYGIYRIGQLYRDPKTGEKLGVEAIDIGGGQLQSLEGDVATIDLHRSTQEIRRADRLLPPEERKLNAHFEPNAAPEGVDGYIIAVEGGLTQIGSMDVVTLNLGERNQVTTGDVMAIYSHGILVRDPITNERIKAPDIQAGILMVFQSYEKLSYALVLKAEQSLKVGDRVSSPR